MARPCLEGCGGLTGRRCYRCLCWFGHRWRWAPSSQPQMWVFQGNHRQLWAGVFFPSSKARREGKPHRLEKPRSRNAECGVAARSGCKYGQRGPAVAAVPMDGETQEDNARGEQDHEALELGAVKDPVVGWMATAEHLSRGISHGRCWHLLCSPSAAPCRLPSLPVLPSQANLPSFLLSSGDYYFFFPLSLERTMLGGKGSRPALGWLPSAA